MGKTIYGYCEKKGKHKLDTVKVSPTEPTGEHKEKVWIQNADTEQKMYILNDNNEYKEFYKDSGWNLLTQTGEDYAAIRYRKIGKMVELNSPWYSENGINIAAYGTVLLGTLPEGFRPSQKLYTPIMCKNSNNEIVNSCYVIVNQDGTIMLSNVTNIASNSINTIYFQVMYYAS